MFSIGIPTINRQDLLAEALQYYSSSMKQTSIIICDNGNQVSIISNENIVVYKQEKNLGVAGSWNFLLNKIFNSTDYALILNDDIILQKSYDELCNFIQSSQADFIRAGYGFSSFVLPKSTYELVGNFDEKFFPGYYEDNDFEYRVKLAGLKVCQTDFLNAEVFRNSSSIEKNPKLNNQFQENQERYIAKWGGLPYEETFTTPFGV